MRRSGAKPEPLALILEERSGSIPLFIYLPPLFPTPTLLSFSHVLLRAYRIAPETYDFIATIKFVACGAPRVGDSEGEPLHSPVSQGQSNSRLFSLSASLIHLFRSVHPYQA